MTVTVKEPSGNFYVFPPCESRWFCIAFRLIGNPSACKEISSANLFEAMVQIWEILDQVLYIPVIPTSMLTTKSAAMVEKVCWLFGMISESTKVELRKNVGKERDS